MFLIGFPNIPLKCTRQIDRLLQWSNWSRSGQLNHGRPTRSLETGNSVVLITTVYFFIVCFISIQNTLSLERRANA